MAEITDEERRAASNLKEIARYNAGQLNRQVDNQLSNFDFANTQNRSLADTERQQASRKTSTDSFNALRNLQDATIGVAGSMGTALNGSSAGNLMSMLRGRQDLDNSTYWQDLQENWDNIENTYNDTLNQNNVAKNDTVIKGEKALADMQADLSANLNNINPDLYEAPGTGETNLGTGDMGNKKVAENLSKISGYIMPDNYFENVQAVRPRNKVSDADYFGALVNRFNGR